MEIAVSISIFFLRLDGNIAITTGISINSMKLKKLPAEEDLLSGPRIARKIDVDPATVRRWVREGAPHHVLGHKLIRFKLDELLAWRAKRP
jgi:hypothetical protein